MKSNKEFIDGIYEKYDEYLKEKERKTMKKSKEKEKLSTKPGTDGNIANRTRNRWQ